MLFWSFRSHRHECSNILLGQFESAEGWCKYIWVLRGGKKHPSVTVKSRKKRKAPDIRAASDRNDEKKQSALTELTRMKEIKEKER